MYRLKLIAPIALVIALFVCLYFNLRKDVVYIRFENIPDYNFKYLGHSKLNPEKVILNQTGDFWYQSWVFDLDTSHITIIDSEKLNKMNIVSQYWIINNLNGFAVGFDYSKTRHYKLEIVRSEGEKSWIYPVKKLHFITE